MCNTVETHTESSEKVKRFLESLHILAEYQMDESIAHAVSEIFSTREVQSWPIRVHALAIENRFGSTSSEKNISTLITELQGANTANISTGLASILTEIDRIYESNSSILYRNNPIKIWTKADIQEWAEKILHRSSELVISNPLPEIIAVIKRAVYLDSNFEPRHIQILVLLIVLDPNHTGGRLLQILTGEGKSTIISMLAVIKALQGNYVDIVTSSITLAKRDAHAKQNFYSMFNLTTSHNNDETSYISGPKACYLSKIVYGNSSQFQFDMLRHEFNLLHTRKDRRCDVVIIDEVDSMLIDETNTIARLADQLPGMEWLNSLLFGIWRCVNVDAEPLAKRDALVEKIKNLIDDPQSPMNVPRHLHCFVLQSIPLWIDHAIRAKLEYHLDHHYMIKPDETNTKRIIPIDFSNTGVVQCSTTWSDGLHQFLQIKHGLKITTLTVTTNYLSNAGLFTRYNNQIYGLTGTLGSNDAQALLRHIYHVDTIVIPPFKQKRHVLLNTILTSTDEEWLKTIVSSTLVHVGKNRAVLIICETRLDAKMITKQLQRTYTTGSIRAYTDNTDAIESSAVHNRIEHGEIVVATNLAGRGTDLKTSQEVEKHGGLHVCLTFLPNNLRVEDQALGRTSRQGNRGTSQLILSKERVFHQLMSCYPEYWNDPGEKPTNPIELIRDWRAKAESAHLDRIRTKEIYDINEKDALFRNFCELLAQLRTNKNDIYRLQSVKERWGLWLKSMDHAVQSRLTLERLVEEVGFRCLEVPRDGDSLFHAVSHHLQVKLSVDAIKTRVVDHILDNEDFYKEMNEKQRYWAISRALNVNIVLFRSDYSGPYVYKRENAECICVLGYEVDTHYMPLEPLNSDYKWKEIYLDGVDIDVDGSKMSQSASEIKRIINTLHLFTNNSSKREHLYTAMLTKSVNLNLHDAFNSFKQQIQEEYDTDQIIQNPCYLILEADDMIAKLCSWTNRVQSAGKTILFLEQKEETFNQPVNRLERAINLDPVFAFSALVNHAYLIINNHQPSTGYKFEAKKHLTRAQELIGQFILPQLHSMQFESHNKSNEFIYDDLAKQIQTKVEILQLYQNHIGRAISSIESSQKLIDVLSKQNQKVYVGRKLYGDEAGEFVQKYNGTIELNFHSLLMTHDVVKKDQAIQLLKLVPMGYRYVSMQFFDMTVEIMQKMLPTTWESVCWLNIQYLDGSEVRSMMEKDEVDLELTASMDQYLRAIKAAPSNITLNMESVRQQLSPEEAMELIRNDAGRVRSIRFESIDKRIVDTIIDSVEQAAYSLTFNRIQISRMRTIVENISKPFSLKFQLLTTSEACILIESSTERNFILGLHELTASNACQILKNFDRNEQDVKVSLKHLAKHLAKTDQPYEELNAYANMGVSQLIFIEELNPRPWISISIMTAFGVSQFVGGICLTMLTCGLGTTLGISLIAEGINDLYFAVQGAISRQFSWKSYAIQKGISIAMCFLSVGFSVIAKAGQVAWTSTNGVSQFWRASVQEAGNIIKTSATKLVTGTIPEAAAVGWKFACRQVAISSAKIGIKEIVNSPMHSYLDRSLSRLQADLNDKIRSIVDAELIKDDYGRIIDQALTAGTYYETDRWRENIEQIAVKCLIKQKDDFPVIAKSHLQGITNKFLSLARQSINETTSSDSKISQKVLSTVQHVTEEFSRAVVTITNIFFAAFKYELAEFEQKIPTFEDLLIHASDQSITLQTATGIKYLLIEHSIINKNGTVNIPSVAEDDAPDFIGQWTSSHTTARPLARCFTNTLMKDLPGINFIDENHKQYALKVLNKLRGINRKSVRTVMLRKKIAELLNNQVLTLLHGILITPLKNCVVDASKDLSSKLQEKLDVKSIVGAVRREEEVERYSNLLSNDIVRDIQSGKIQVSTDIIIKLNDLIDKQMNQVRDINDTEQLALNILANKPGGVIEMCVIAAMIGKPISVIHQQINDASMLDKQDIPSYIDDNTDKIVENQYTTDMSNGGQNDCLYATIFSTMPDKFESIQDVRIKTVVFILTSPNDITGILPAMNIINVSQDSIQQIQLMSRDDSFLNQTDVQEKFDYFKNHAKDLSIRNTNQMAHIACWLVTNSLYIDIELDVLVLLCPNIHVFNIAGFKLDRIRLYRTCHGPVNIDGVTSTVLSQMIDIGNIGLSIYCSYKGEQHVKRVQEYKTAASRHPLHLMTHQSEDDLQPVLRDHGTADHIRANPNVVMIYTCQNTYFHYRPGQKDIFVTDDNDDGSITMLTHKNPQHDNDNNLHYMTLRDIVDKKATNLLGVESANLASLPTLGYVRTRDMKEYQIVSRVSFFSIDVLILMMAGP